MLQDKFPAHSAGMCDMDVVGHCLVTCGLTHRYGQLCVDPELTVMDLRMLRPLPPLPAPMPQPMLVRAMPSMPSTALLLSQLGEFQFVDIRGLMTPANMTLHQLQLPPEGAMPCACDVSSSSHCLAFGDSCGLSLSLSLSVLAAPPVAGQVHLWMCGEEAVMNTFAQPSVLPDQVYYACTPFFVAGAIVSVCVLLQPESCPELSWDGSGAPLAAVPLPVCSEPLLSDWPSHNSRFMRRSDLSVYSLPESLLLAPLDVLQRLTLSYWPTGRCISLWVMPESRLTCVVIRCLTTFSASPEPQSLSLQ